MFDLAFLAASYERPFAAARAFLNVCHSSPAAAQYASDESRLQLQLTYMRLFFVIRSYVHFNTQRPDWREHRVHRDLLRGDLRQLERAGQLVGSLTQLEEIAEPAAADDPLLKPTMLSEWIDCADAAGDGVVVRGSAGDPVFVFGTTS